jgi:protease I
MDHDKPLSGKTVAVLVASGFEEAEMTDTQKALVASGARPRIVSPEIGLANGWHEGTWGHNFYVEVKVGDVLPSQYDALLVPGGARSMETLLNNAHARRIVKGMVEGGKPVGIVSNAVELLLATELVRGRTIASLPEYRERVEAAGGNWGDDAVATDGALVSSAGGPDLAAFVDAFLAVIEQTVTAKREAA